MVLSTHTFVTWMCVARAFLHRTTQMMETARWTALCLISRVHLLCRAALWLRRLARHTSTIKYYLYMHMLIIRGVGAGLLHFVLRS